MGLKNLAMLPSYFNYIFMHLKQKARLWPELSSKFLSTLDPNPARLTTLMVSHRNMVSPQIVSPQKGVTQGGPRPPPQLPHWGLLQHLRR